VLELYLFEGALGRGGGGRGEGFINEGGIIRKLEVADRLNNARLCKGPGGCQIK
jgi:hypothetical protein